MASSPSPLNTSAALSRLLDQLEPYPPSLEADPSERITALDQALWGIKEWLLRLVKQPNPSPETLSSLTTYVSTSLFDYVVAPGAISPVDLAAVDEEGEGAKAKIMLETVSGFLRWLAERTTAVDEEGERKGWGGAVVGVLEGLMAHLVNNGVGNKTPSDLAYRTLICTLLAQTLIELVIPSAKELPGSSSMELDDGVAMGAKYAALDVLGELMSKNEESKKYLRSILPADHLGALLQAGYDSHLSQLAFELAFRLLPASSRSLPTSHPKTVARKAYLAELFSKDRFAGAAQDLRDKFGEIRVQEWDEGVEKVLQVIADAHIRRSQPFRALSITYNSHQLLHPSAARSSSNSPRAPSPSLSLHEGLPAGLPTLEQIAAEHYEPVKLWICRHMVGAEVRSTTEGGMDEIKRMVAEFEGVEKVWVEDLGRELDILSLTFLLSPSRPLTLQTHPYPSSPSRLGLSQRPISDTQLSDKRSSGNEPTRYHELKVLLEGKGNNLEVLKRTLVERSTRYPKLGEEIPDFPHRSAVLRSAAGAPPTRAPAPALQQHGKNVTFAPMPTERQQRRKSSQAEEPIVGAFGGRATPGSGPSQLASPAEADEEEQEALARSSQEAARRREEAATLARLGSDGGSGASGRSEPEGEGVEGLGGMGETDQCEEQPGMGEHSWSVLQVKAKAKRKAAGPHEREHDTIESATSAIIETTTNRIGTRVLVPDSPMSPRSISLAAAEAANSKSAPAGPAAVTSTSKTKAKATLAEPAAVASSKAKGKQPTATSTSKATPGSLAAPTSKATPAHPVNASTSKTKAKQPALAPGQSRGKEESTPSQRAALVEKAQGDPSSELSVLEPSPKMGKSAPTKGKGKAARSDADVDRNVDETAPATSDVVEAEKTGEVGVRPKKVVSSNYAPRGKSPADAKEIAQPAPVDVDEDEGAQDQQDEEEEPVSALATRRNGAKSTKVKSAGPSKGKKVAPPVIVVNAKATKRARRTSASDEESQLSDEEPDADAGSESDLPDPKDVASAKKQKTTAPVKKVVEPFKSKLKAKSSKRRKVSPPSDADDDQLSQHTDYDYPGKVGSTLEEKRVVGMSAKTYGKDKKAGRPKVMGTTKKAGGRGKRKLEEETGGDSEPPAPAKKKPARSTRAAAAAAKKKVAKQVAESEAFEFEAEEQEQEQEEKEEEPMKKAAKGKEVALKKGTGKKAQAEEDEDGESPEKSPPPPPAKKYKDMRVSDDIPSPFDLTKTKRSSKQRAPASIADDASSRKSKAIRSFSQLVREPSKDVAPEAAQDEIFQPVVEGDDYQEYFEHDNHAADVAAAAAAALNADRMDVDRQPTPLKMKQKQQQQLAPEPARTGSGRSISPMLDPAKDVSFVDRAVGLQPSAQAVRSALEAAPKVLVEYNPAASVRAQEHAKVNTYLGEHMISSQKAPASDSDQGDVDMVGVEEYVEQESDMGEAETDGFYSAPGAADDSGVHFQVQMDEGTQGDDEDESVVGCDEAAAQQEQASHSLPVRPPATSRPRAIRSRPVPVQQQQQQARFPAAAPVPSTSKHALPQPVRPTRTLQQGPSKPRPSAAASTQAPADGAHAAAAPPGVLLSRPSVSAFAAHPPPTDPKSRYKGGGKQVQLDVPPTPQREDHQPSDLDDDFTSDDLEAYNCFEDFARVMAHKNRQRRCERQVHHELSMRKFDQALNKYLTATLNQTANLVNSAQAFVDERLNPEKGQVAMKLDASAQRVRAVNRKLWQEAETELAAIEKEEAEAGARAKGKQKERA
ncbi:hypothetical protein JCM5296_001957 [Sporobolomyces johnsonii]